MKADEVRFALIKIGWPLPTDSAKARHAATNRVEIPLKGGGIYSGPPTKNPEKEAAKIKESIGGGGKGGGGKDGGGKGKGKR